MSDKVAMTVKSYKFLQEELHRMKSIERPKASKAIEEARAHGDLSENAEYHAAREAQGMLEARIKVVEGQLANAQVVDVTKLSGNKVLFGATVTVIDLDSGEEKKFTIVGDEESDVARGYISYNTPLARGMIGKSVDDIATVRLPSGEKELEIISVEFIET